MIFIYMTKKIIRLTESEFVEIVNRVINEQQQNYDFIFSRNTSLTEPTKAEEIYLVKNGDTYDVFAKRPKSNIIEKTEFSLPKLSELSLRWNGSTFENNETTETANMIASLIKTNFERSQGNWVVYTKENGLPAIGKLSLGPVYDFDILDKYKKNRKKLKTGESYTPNDYFIVKQNKGRSLEVKDVEEAKPYEV
jgi:hypothetical protein